MNFLTTPRRKKILFTSLYLSEGAPIGFLWLALPTRLRSEGVSIDQITWLTAILVLPWTFKFAWAPLVDLLRSDAWGLRQWIIAAQCSMGVTLLPLLWLDPVSHFPLLAGMLLIHAFAAATQDVAIDALCISTTQPHERGEFNGWMQAGMLIGRASMGGGALVLASYLGEQAVVGLLVLITTGSMLLVIASPLPNASTGGRAVGRLGQVTRAVAMSARDRNSWIGLAFAATGGAAFKSLEVIYGPFLIDRGFTQQTIGWFSLGPMIGAMIIGSIVGGRLADRIHHRRCVAVSLVMIVLGVVSLAAVDYATNSSGSYYLLLLLAMTAFGIGVFTASSYALFMDLTHPNLAATQFSAFMGATNGCESWSTFASGRIIAAEGYPSAMMAMSLASCLSLPLLAMLRKNDP